MIVVDHVTKHYGHTVALRDLSFEVPAGVITGFLGPNGSGKSTTMRVIMGLDAPQQGRATINGKTYRELSSPLHQVGALLDAKSVHPGRSARNHLRAMAASNGISRSRCDDVLEFVGLTAVANRRVGEFSLGMSQRLGIAVALLGDPAVLLFDEPINGLDPEGIRWIRDVFRTLAAEGRTILVSSHLMSEMALTADQVIVIGRGSFITRGTVDELTSAAARDVLVRSQDNARLAEAITAAGGTTSPGPGGSLQVAVLDAATVGQLALRESIALSELTPVRASLEDVFMELTASATDYTSSAGAANV